MVLSQDVGKGIETEQVATEGKVVVKELKGKVVPTEVFGNGATFNNCSFV